MKLLASVLLCFLAAWPTVFAEIEKIAVPGEKGISFYWWPRLRAVEGWHQDREHSFQYGVNAFAPNGFTFATAETVMYARAIYKPRELEVKSLEMLIENDKKEFLVNTPGILIEEVDSLTTAEGKRLRSFTFFPKRKGNWERVSYGEEGDFFLIFTLSSRSSNGYKRAASTYKKLLWQYREKP